MTAPMAPSAPQVVAPMAPDLFVLSANDNHKQLAWNKPFNEYYRRDWKAETAKYLSDKIEESPRGPTNWRWYHYQAKATNEIPPLRGNSLSDIGNDSMITIGDRRRIRKIDIYRINKHFDTFEKLEATGASPCCRFCHSAEYIPMINAIFFFAGFDSTCNFNDARLLCLDTLTWYSMQHSCRSLRAHHASVTRLIQTDKGTHKFEVYLFGGMYCQGGPYAFHNDMWKFTFCDDNYGIKEHATESTEVPLSPLNPEQAARNETYSSINDNASGGYFECEEVVAKCAKVPVERSQSHSWIHKDKLYIFGGTTARSTLNDLWEFDLKTNVWKEIEYQGVLGAPETITIKPRNYKVGASRKPCYFDSEREQLIVVHYGTLSDIQKRYTKFGGTMKEFKQEIASEYKAEESGDVERKPKRLKGAIGMLQDTMKCRIFVLDMHSKQWLIKRDMNVIKPHDVPSKLVGNHRILRIGDYLIQIGGGAKGSANNYLKNLFMLKIPRSTWKEERLLWIAHHKNSESILNKCPKDIITAVISFIREY
eukprot:305205_1